MATIIGYPVDVRHYWLSFQDHHIFDDLTRDYYVVCEAPEAPEVGETVFVWEHDGYHGENSFGYLATVVHVGPIRTAESHPYPFVHFDVKIAAGSPFFKSAPWTSISPESDLVLGQHGKPWNPPWDAPETVSVSTWINDVGAIMSGPFTRPPTINGKPLRRIA